VTTVSGILRIGTRASALALWQTERVRVQLAQLGYATERVEIRTTGDVVQEVPLSRLGGRAFFTKQLDDAMLEGRIDIAIHSLKDLPTELPEGIALAAVGQREDARDALVARQGLTWGTLPRGAVIATSSHRRRAQLLRARPDLELTDIRGNVDTRLKKLDGHAEWSAIVLAAAGLVRLGLSERISERLPFAVMLPAPGQGALAATIRADDAAAGEAVRRALHHEDTAIAVSAERGLLRRLQGGCQVPVGAYATVDRQGDQAMVQLHARVVALNGAVSVESVRSGSTATIEAAEMLGEALADDLLGQGGAEILRSIRESGVQPISEP
jgi:hydroxymethylbilane synthase